MASPGPWPPENLEYYVRSSETTHVDEPSDEGIIEHLEKCLDLYFSSPGQYRYVDGYTFFDSGF